MVEVIQTTFSQIHDAKQCTPTHVQTRQICAIYSFTMGTDASCSDPETATQIANFFKHSSNNNGVSCVVDVENVRSFYARVNAVFSASVEKKLKCIARSCCNHTQDERDFAAAAYYGITGTKLRAQQCRPWYKMWITWVVIGLLALILILAIVSIAVAASNHNNARKRSFQSAYDMA